MVMCAWNFAKNRARGLGRRFARNVNGTVAITFGLALIPIMTAVGAAVDYSRANSFKAILQASIDAAIIVGAKDGSSNWANVATNAFKANLAAKSTVSATPTFTFDGTDLYSGTVSVDVPTVVLAVIKIDKMKVGAYTQAKLDIPDDSCILTLDKGSPKSNVALKLNGAPVINLAGCSLRSNTSLDCNGHDGNVTKSYGAGTAEDCGQPKSNVPVVPDIYADLAKNITPLCGSDKSGYSWTAGSSPPSTGPGVKTVVNAAGITEYHICGNLNLSGDTGSGYLIGSPPSSDSIIVVENGSINMADDAVIKTLRTTIVMTGDNSVSTKVNFPMGASKNATLSLSPSTSSTNPWQGVAFFLDPKLTNHANVDNTWGPGATFNVDGLAYFGYSNVVTDGNTASNNAKCSKFVMNAFTTNGHVDLTMSQSTAACAALGLKQWGGVVVHLVK